MTRQILLALLIGLPLLSPEALSDSERARTLLNEARAQRFPDSSSQVLSMKLIDKGGATRERELKAYRRKTAKGWQSRIEFLKPADVAGTVLIIHEDDGGKSEMFLWAPRVKRVRRISGQARGGAFMGSDFTFEDLTLGDTENAALTDLPDITKEKIPYYVIEAKPKKAGDSAYARAVFYVAQETKALHEVNYFGKGDAPIKILTIDPNATKAVAEWKVPGRMVMHTLKDDHRSELTVSDINVTDKLSDALFDHAALGR